jgi:hypothetical protein
VAEEQVEPDLLQLSFRDTAEQPTDSEIAFRGPSLPPTGFPSHNSIGVHALINALGIQTMNQLGHWQFEDLADAEEGGHRNGASGLHLLPVAGGKAEAQHIFLRIAALLAKLSHSRAQSAEECFLIRHPLRCKVLRAETPRAD